MLPQVCAVCWIGRKITFIIRRSIPISYQKVEYRLEVMSCHSSHGAVEMVGPKSVNAERVLHSLDCI